MTGRAGALGSLRCCGTLLNSSSARRTSASEGLAENSTDTVTVCPSTTGTRLQCALTFDARSSTEWPVKSPRIFCVSCSIFSSSPPMNGITLALMSMEGTPGYPAPEIACMVVTITRRMPNGFSAASAITRTMVEQLGLVTIAPPHPRCWRCCGMSFKCDALISGTRSGTSASMRWLRELDTTMWPAEAKACSISVATDASIAEKTSCGAFPVAAFSGLDSDTTMSRTYAGVSPPKRHAVASLYGLPAERSLAPSQVRSNQGWSRRKLTNSWPTIPVAPRIPTEIRDWFIDETVASLSFCRFQPRPQFPICGCVLRRCGPDEWCRGPAGTAFPRRLQTRGYQS